MDAKTERLITAIRAWVARWPPPPGEKDVVPSPSLTPPPGPVQRDLAEAIATKKAELETAGLLPLLHHQPPRRTP